MTQWPVNPITVALVGRVNVGKSTLFNKITEQTRAIVSTVPGTTRDANSGVAKWADREFTLIDTGGFQKKPATEIDARINKRSHEWVRESSLVVLVVDAKTGLLPEDTVIARDTQKDAKKVVLVVNKTDGKSKHASADWYSLGLGEPVFLSATEGSGVGNFLDAVVAAIPKRKTELVTTTTIGLIGRPNVGKSSLTNVLAGREIQVVSNEAHTTREPHPVYVNRFKKHFLFIDTAGIRKKGKQDRGIEKRGIKLSERIASDVDINWLILEADKDITTQDKTLAKKLTGTNRGLIIVMNKWDKVADKTTNTMKKMEKYLAANFSTLKWAEIKFVSAKDKKGIAQLLTLTEKLEKKQHAYVDKQKLQQIWQIFLKRHPAMRPSGHSLTPSKARIQFLSFAQIDVNPLTFQMTVTKKDVVPAALINILEKEIRKTFSLSGLPIIMSIHRLKK